MTIREPVGKVIHLQKSADVYENKSQDTCFAVVLVSCISLEELNSLINIRSNFFSKDIVEETF